MNLCGLGCRSSTLSGVELHDGHTAGLFLYWVSLLQQKVKRCRSVSSASVFVTFAGRSKKFGEVSGENDISAVYSSLSQLLKHCVWILHWRNIRAECSYLTRPRCSSPRGTFHTLPRQQMWHCCELHVTYHWQTVKAATSQAAGEPRGHTTPQYRGNYWTETLHGYC